MLIGRDARGRLPLRCGSLGEVVHDLNLEGLIPAHQCGTLIVEGVLGESEPMVRGDALRHLGLDGGQIVGGEGAL